MQQRAEDMAGAGENLIFLVSQPRAGSTMVQRILGAHQEILTVSEPWLALHPLSALREQGITADYDHALARRALKEFLRQLPDGEEAYWHGIRRMLSDLYGRALEGSGKKIFLDKTPRYYIIIPELRRVFPRARIVILLRNPLAVLASILNTWTQGENPWQLRSFRHDLLAAPRLLAEAIREMGAEAIAVRYEEIVAEPEKSVRGLCQRLGIEFHPGMIDYGAATERWAYGDQGTVYKAGRPDGNYAGQWLSVLSRSPKWEGWARSYLTTLGRDLVNELGYDFDALQADLPGSGESGDWGLVAEPDDEVLEIIRAGTERDSARGSDPKERCRQLEAALAERLIEMRRKQEALLEIAAAAERRREKLQEAVQAVHQRDARIAELEARVAALEEASRSIWRRCRNWLGLSKPV